MREWYSARICLTIQARWHAMMHNDAGERAAKLAVVEVLCMKQMIQ